MKGKLVTIVLLLFSVFMFYEALSIEDGRQLDPLGAKGFPLIVISIIIIMCMISLIKDWKTENEEENNKVNKEFIGVLVSLVVFLLVIEWIGFLLAAIFLSSCILALISKQIKMIQTVAISLGLSIVASFVFGQLLNVPLPRGGGIFEIISRLIY